MRQQWKNSGFTFIEILTVTVLIAVVTSIAVVSYINVARNTRDARRKKDIAQLQLAVEAYKQVNGSFPTKGTGCNGFWAYPGCQSSGEWIQGLIPEYLATMPTDPKQNGGQNLEMADQFSYRYRTTATGYQISTKLENTADDILNGPDYGYPANIYVVEEYD